MAHPRLPQARFRRQAHWDLASGGRWRASVKLPCGSCVATEALDLGLGPAGRIRVSRKRVLRVMRENNLLSPHRHRSGNPHDGEIITHAPNLMWGTDGVQVFTVDDGRGWIVLAALFPSTAMSPSGPGRVETLTVMSV